MSGVGWNAWHSPGAQRFEGKALSHWARVLTEDRVTRRKLWSQIGPALVPYLVKEMQRYDPYSEDMRFKYHFALYSKTPWWLRRHLPEPFSKEERCLNAIILLGQLGPAAKDAVPALIPLLDDDIVAGNFIHTLGCMGPAAKEAVPKLIESLEKGAPWVAITLGRIGASDAVPVLRRTLTNGPIWLRREAASVLAHLQPEHLAKGPDSMEQVMPHWGQWRPTLETRILMPAEMIAVGDVMPGETVKLPPAQGTEDLAMPRPIQFLSSRWFDVCAKDPSRWPSAIHNGQANMLFGDGHLESVRQTNWVRSTETAGRRWNNDHEPHRDTWER